MIISVYIIAFSNTRIEIFQVSPTTGDISSIQALTGQSWLVNTSAAPYLEEYTFAQQGDVMFICHQTVAPRKLIRTGLTTFTVETFNFESSVNSEHVFQPYYPFQALGVTISASATATKLMHSVPHHLSRANKLHARLPLVDKTLK